MKNISAVTHLYRLGALFVVFIVVFVTIRQLVTPPSWNYEVWYRGDSLTEVGKLPLTHGGNESCQACHADTVKTVKRKKHKNLSCEGCHGPLDAHVGDAEKIGDAVVIIQSRRQCLNCHAELTSKPKAFPQFTDEVKKHRTMQAEEVCLKCHDAHNPTP